MRSWKIRLFQYWLLFLETVFLPLLKGVPFLPRLPFVLEQFVAILDALGCRVAVIQFLPFGDCLHKVLPQMRPATAAPDARQVYPLR